MRNWPSTTGVLRFFGFMAGLELYGNEEAMQRGRLVTEACHLLADGQPFNEGWEARHPECHAYIDAYRRFLREHRFRLIEYEGEYVSEIHRFVSHPDQLGELDGEGLVDLELKSGSMPAWCRLQTGGQVLAMNRPMPRFGLWLKHDGSYRLYPHDDIRDIDRFRALVDAYWTIQEFGNGDPAIIDR